MAEKDLNSLLKDVDGFILLMVKNGQLSSRLSGAYQEIFDKLFGSSTTWPPLKGNGGVFSMDDSSPSS